MAFDLRNFDDNTLSEDYLAYLVEQEAVDAHVHFSRLWDHFRNPLQPATGLSADALNANSRPYFQAQEAHLPTRITGISRLGIGGEQMTDIARKEVVIENDIGWRVQTMVDFLFGKPLSIRSLAPDAARAQMIEAVIHALLEANGGIAFFQELALLGAVYGFVDVVLRTPSDWFTLPVAIPPTGTPQSAADGPRAGAVPPPTSAANLERVLRLAERIGLETIDAPRVLPILDDDDYRHVRYWIQCFRKQVPQLDVAGRPFESFGWAGRRELGPRTVEVVEIIGPDWFQRYEDRVLLAEGPNRLGRLSVVHVQNVALPGQYEGLSDVEPLIPLQDELNTRLSDRASRVTFQSFKMYLAKGIEGFLERPVGPGQMWSTHNQQASIEEFGHDSGSPSEEAHVQQIRHALDKVSGVTPLAAGLIQGAVGNLTSATALRVLLSGLLSRTHRKQITYGRGLAQIVELALELLDRCGVLRTSPAERKVEIHWPSPLPEDEGQRLANAQVKLSLGVPRQRVLTELGYDAQMLAGDVDVQV